MSNIGRLATRKNMPANVLQRLQTNISTIVSSIGFRHADNYSFRNASKYNVQHAGNSNLPNCCQS